MKRKARVPVLTVILGIALALPSLLHSFSEAPGRERPISGIEASGRRGLADGGDVVFVPPGAIRGTLDLLVPFETYPGEEIRFDLELRNLEAREIATDVELRLEPPTSPAHTLLHETILLGPEETRDFPSSEDIPESLEEFGRYTLKLFINGWRADFLQFDLHERGGIEVRWDDGELANGWAFRAPCNAWAIRGCLPAGSVLDSIGVRLVSEGDAAWPWPDDIHQDILLQVWDNDGPRGLPGTLLYSEVSRVTPGTGQAVAHPGIPITSAFYISNAQLTGYPACEAQGVDRTMDEPDQMFERLDGVWQSAQPEIGGDLMIWGVAHVGTERIVTGTPPPSD